MNVYICKIPRNTITYKYPKTNIKICNSKKEEFNKQVTAEGEKMNVKIVTRDVNQL